MHYKFRFENVPSVKKRQILAYQHFKDHLLMHYITSHHKQIFQMFSNRLEQTKVTKAKK